MHHSTLTSKGQTTLPAQVRNALHLKTGDRIHYEIKGDSVLIRPHLGAMAVFGALKPAAALRGLPFSEAREKARQIQANDASRKGLK